jgi:hypothetical protein
MADQFPGTLTPSDRSYKAGSYPTRVYRAMSGATVKRSFGNAATGYELKLEYKNISDADAATYITHYNSTAGGFDRFTIPASISAGMSDTENTTLLTLANISWEYAQPPDVTYVYRDICTMTITLIGELTA